jgi:hypothetical protein
MPTIRISDFSGGLNLRDSPIELAPSETPDAINWRLDQRGAIRLRKGCSNVAALPGSTGEFAYIFPSTALGQWFCIRYDGSTSFTRIYKRPADLSGSWTSVSTLGITGTKYASAATIVDWPGATPLIAVAISDPAGTQTNLNGTWTYDGTTFTAGPAGINGRMLALWQNRVWLARPVNEKNKTRLYFTALGTAGDYNGGGNVDLRDLDAEEITALGLSAGALQTFKHRSAYRVNDSSTASYSTVDSASGAKAPHAVVGQRGRLYTWGADSLYEWDGIGPGRRIGDKARPLFDDAALSGVIPGLCGGPFEDGTLFAYPSSGGGANDRLLEYDPQHGWLMKHQLAGSTKTQVSSLASKDGDTYAAIKNGDVIFKFNGATAGADDGVLFTNNYRTAWFEPYGGKLCRIQRAIVEGLLVNGGTNTLTMKVYKDGDLSTSDSYDITADLRASSSTDIVQTAVVNSLGHARSFAFEFVAGTASGDASVFALEFDWTPLER